LLSPGIRNFWKCTATARPDTETLVRDSIEYDRACFGLMTVACFVKRAAAAKGNKMNVTWIGLGRVGKQMALRVVAADHKLVGHARDPAKHATAAVAEAELVCINVFDEAQLRSALIEGGALAEMKAGAVLVIHSTVGPCLIREIAGIRSDIRVLDAPFSGRDSDAVKGQIALMVGGDAVVLDEVSPVLGSYANFIQHMGAIGAGATTKLVNNALFGAQMLLAHDALRILTNDGIDPEIALATLGRSSGASFALQQYGSGIDAGALLMSVWPYIQKDTTLVREAAAQSGLDFGMLDTATRPYLKDAPSPSGS
jgi:3-hydroxyisobutyrate dehydrogenase-like beta-hydroxyacid dehydrogenase